MKEALQQRLEALRAEYDAGQKVLADLDAKRQNVTATLLRIEGAMEVLRELLAKDAGEAAPPPGNAPARPATG